MAGIAAYFLWPATQVIVDTSEPAMSGHVERLAGLTVPQIPSYLSNNRPPWVVMPNGFSSSAGPLGKLFSQPNVDSLGVLGNPLQDMVNWGDNVFESVNTGLPMATVVEPDNNKGGCCC